VTRATVLKTLAWLLLAGLIFVTLSPINLRPISPLPTQVERAIALAIVGFAFAIAYPRHIILVACLVFVSTVALELLQLATPSRHGRVLDAVVKLSGGGIGLALGWIWSRGWRRNR
jgi:hypothetical protein